MQELANDPKVQGLLEKIDAKFERAGLWSPWAALPQGAPPALPRMETVLKLDRYQSGIDHSLIDLESGMVNWY